MAEYQVVDKTVHDAELKSIGDSIRAKGGTTAPFNSAAEMKAAVDAIQTGSGGACKVTEVVIDKEAANGFDLRTYWGPMLEKVQNVAVIFKKDLRIYPNNNDSQFLSYVYKPNNGGGWFGRNRSAIGNLQNGAWGDSLYDGRMHIGDVYILVEI